MKIEEVKTEERICELCGQPIGKWEAYYHWRDRENKKTPHVYKHDRCVNIETTQKLKKRNG